jgi:predicted nucleic acid-binding protein
VLQEFAVVALSKLRQASDFVLRRLGQFESLEVVQVTPYLVRRGVELHDRYRTHFWDALVLAAAEHAGCHRVWSEDLSAKTDYGSVRVENPFSDL